MGMTNCITASGLKAGEALTAKQYYAVKVDASEDRAVIAIANANAPDYPIGILQNDPADGEAAEVAIMGQCKAIYGGNVTRGNLLSIDNDGKLIAETTVVAQDGADLPIVAIALESGAVNEIHEVILVQHGIEAEE